MHPDVHCVYLQQTRGETPQCPLTEESLETRHIHSGTPPSHREAESRPGDGDGPECRVSEGAADKRGRQSAWRSKGGLWKRNDADEAGNRDACDREDELRCGGGGEKGEAGSRRCTGTHGLLWKWITNEHLLHGTRSSAQGCGSLEGRRV